jgi:hypothetical protein
MKNKVAFEMEVYVPISFHVNFVIYLFNVNYNFMIYDYNFVFPLLSE